MKTKDLKMSRIWNTKLNHFFLNGHINSKLLLRELFFHMFC